MRAVQITDAGVTLTDRPAPAGDGVRIRVTSSGICGSDLHAMRFGAFAATPGHEFGGLLDDGSLVAVLPMVSCGSCEFCLRGHEQLCRQSIQRYYGGSLDGGMAEEVVVEPRCVVPVPDGVEPTSVGLVEPIAVAVHAVNRAVLAPGDRVAVVGGGPIGLLCAAVLRDRSHAVNVVARHPAQVRAAEALGASTTTEGRYTVVFDAAGTESSAEQTVRMTERGGRIVLVAVPWDPISYGFFLVQKEVSIVPAMTYGTHDGESEFVAAARFLGAHPELPDVLVTHRFGLEDTVTAFAVAADRAAGAIKVQLLP